MTRFTFPEPDGTGRFLWLGPGLLAAAPWLVLHGIGAREHVVVITGTLTGPTEALLGLGYVASWLLAVLVAPPLLASGLIASVAARSGRSPGAPRPPAAGRGAAASAPR